MADAGKVMAGDAYVGIHADASSLKGGLTAVEGSLVGWARKVGGLVGITLGVGMITRFARSAVQARAEEELSQIDLASAVGASYDKFEAFSLILAKTTKMTREQARETIALGATFGKLGGPELEKATRIAVGWAKILRTSPADIAEQLGRAIEGSERAQKMFERSKLMTFAGANTPAGRLAALAPMGELGFARVEAEMSGTAGAIHRAGVAWDEAKEQIGEGVIAFSGLNQVLGDFTESVDGRATEMEGIGAAFGFLALVIISLVRAFVGAAEVIVAAAAWIASKTGGKVGTAVGVLAGPPGWAALILREVLGGSEGAKAFSESMGTAAGLNANAMMEAWIAALSAKPKKRIPRAAKLPQGALDEEGMGGMAGIIPGEALAGALPGRISYGGIAGGAIVPTSPVEALIQGQAQSNTTQTDTLDKLIEIARYTYQIELNTHQSPSPYKVP